MFSDTISKMTSEELVAYKKQLRQQYKSERLEANYADGPAYHNDLCRCNEILAKIYAVDALIEQRVEEESRKQHEAQSEADRKTQAEADAMSAAQGSLF
jgi:hypothetical protein